MTSVKESFAELLEQSLNDRQIRPGSLVSGIVIKVDGKFVAVDVGLKSEALIAKSQFMKDGELTVDLGDEVDVVVEIPDDGLGNTRASRDKARRIETWAALVAKYNNGEPVKGTVLNKVKGGFTVDLDGVRAFLPGSLLDMRTMVDSPELAGQSFEFKIIKVDEKRNNIVVSRRAVIEGVSAEERDKLLDSLEEGQVIKGTVKNLTDYGAFIDLGGIDGLLHITDISWRRIKVPGEVLKLGTEVEVVVLKFDRERNRVSLGMKQLREDPWVGAAERFPNGTKLRGKVTNLTEYGCFVEIASGVEGLVHMSEMDWTNKNINPSKLVQVGDEVGVIVLEIDEDKRRISLGMKQCIENPWAAFDGKYKKGDRLKGAIKSITDFGIFIGLEGNIDGLVHLSDISWDEPGEKAIRNYNKGDEIEVVVLAIDPERERISLGIKQLIDDPFSNYADTHQKGDVVKGKVTSVEAKQAFIELAEEVAGRLKAAEFAEEKTDDLTEKLKEGDEVEARIISVNRKDRVIGLSIRAMSQPVDKKAGSQLDDDIIAPTLGDLLKEHIDNASKS